jgi:hypothetical protein
MSTRSQIDFIENGRLVARIYHHYDGYPSCRLTDIKFASDFYQTVHKGSGYGFSGVSDLAAFYLIYHKMYGSIVGYGGDRTEEATKAIRFSSKSFNELFRPCGVEIDNQLHGDIEYLYEVRYECKELMITILVPKSGFWDNTSKRNMRVLARGKLSDLIKKYKK